MTRLCPLGRHLAVRLALLQCTSFNVYTWRMNQMLGPLSTGYERNSQGRFNGDDFRTVVFTSPIHPHKQKCIRCPRGAPDYTPSLSLSLLLASMDLLLESITFSSYLLILDATTSFMLQALRQVQSTELNSTRPCLRQAARCRLGPVSAKRIETSPCVWEQHLPKQKYIFIGR